MESIKHLLKSNIVSSPNPKLYGAAFVLGLWEKTLVGVEGEKGRGKTKALSFRGGVLKVQVYYQVWLLEITLREQQLVAAFNQELNSSIVKSIKAILLDRP